MSDKILIVSSDELKKMVEELPDGVIIEATFEEGADENEVRGKNGEKRLESYEIK